MGLMTVQIPEPSGGAPAPRIATTTEARVWRTTTRRDCLRLGWNHVRELPRGKDLHLRLARALRGQIPEEQAVPQRIPLPKHRLASSISGPASGLRPTARPL